MSHKDFISALKAEFQAGAQAEVAAGQKAYLRHQFEFLGLSAPERRARQKAFLAPAYLPPKEDLPSLVKALWHESHREFQYFAIDLALAYRKQSAVEDFALYRYMLSHKSWWDSVDPVSTQLVGAYGQKHPEQIEAMVEDCLHSGNIWLQRNALIFQLKYKRELDTDLLRYTIGALKESREFFITKAIGWILREYAKSNPHWVLNFVAQNSLAPLSQREALKHLKKL